MDLTTLVIIFFVCYLLGAISFSRMVHQKLSGEGEIGPVDVKVPGTEYSYTTNSTGASTMGMIHGEKVGCLLGIMDMLKIFIPTLAIRVIYPEQPYFLYAAIAGMIGHIWPVYYRFKGGRGYSSIYGSLMAIEPVGAILCSMTGLIVGIFILKDFAIAYLGGVWLIIPYLWFTTHNVHYLIYAIAVNILFLIAMAPDIRKSNKYRNQMDTNIRKVMGEWPMGRGIIKMCDRFGIPIK